MPRYENTNPANNEDQLEYVIPGPPLQTPSIEGMYFTNIPEKHTTPSTKKGPVVVERAPEGIYDLAGQYGEQYDLSADNQYEISDDKEYRPNECVSSFSKYKIHIFLCIAPLLLGVIFIFCWQMGLLDAFSLTTTENTGDTNGNTSTTSAATKWTNGNLIFCYTT